MPRACKHTRARGFLLTLWQLEFQTVTPFISGAYSAQSASQGPAFGSKCNNSVSLRLSLPGPAVSPFRRLAPKLGSSGPEARMLA